MGNFTDEQDQRTTLSQDTREYPLQSNEYHKNGKTLMTNGGSMGGVGGGGGNGERTYNNGPQCKWIFKNASFYFFVSCFTLRSFVIE